MSISQGRLKDLVLAAEDFSSALSALKSQIDAMKELDPSPGILTLSSLRLESLLQRPLESTRILAEESSRLKLTWKKNLRRSERRAARRAGAEAPTADLEEYIRWKQSQEREVHESPSPEGESDA